MELPVNAQEAQPPQIWAVPHAHTFSAVWNQFSKTYAFTWDEAVKHSHANALAMRRDAFVTGCLNERYLPVQCAPWHIETDDPEAPEQKEFAQRLTGIVKATPRLSQLFRWLLESRWYGRSAVQTMTGRKQVQSGLETVVTDWRPVNGDKIQYRWADDDGTPCLLVNAAKQEELKDKGYDVILTDRAPALVLNRPDVRERFVIATYNPSDADFFEGEMAGGVHGVGLRSMIYWLWWLRNEMLGWACNYMQKVGTLGIICFPYITGNDESKTKATTNAQEASSSTAMTVPVAEGTDPATLAPFVISPSTAGIDTLREMISEYFERHIERLIIGQPGTSKPGATGLGSGVSDNHADTKHQILESDAESLGETCTTDFLGPIVKANWGQVPFGYRMVFALPDPNAAERLEAIGKVIALGLEVKADEVRDAAGLSKPGEDDEILGGIDHVQALNSPQPDPNGDKQSPAREGDGKQAPEKEAEHKPDNSVLFEKLDQYQLREESVNRQSQAELALIRTKMETAESRAEAERYQDEQEEAEVNRQALMELAELRATVAELKAREPQQPPVVNVTTPAPVVNVEAPTVNVAAPAVTVAAPDVNFTCPAPVVNVAAPVVNIPEQKPADITVRLESQSKKVTFDNGPHGTRVARIVTEPA